MPTTRRRRPLLPFPNPPAFIDDVVFVGHTVDLYRPERVPPELQRPIFARDGLYASSEVPRSPGPPASMSACRSQRLEGGVSLRRDAAGLG